MDLNSRGRSLWEVTREGGDLRPLLAGWHTPPDEENGKWTADGKYYVFQSRGQIWALAERAGYFRAGSAHRAEPAYGQSAESEFSLARQRWQALFVLGRTQRGELSRYSGAAHEFLPFLSGISAQGWIFPRRPLDHFVTTPKAFCGAARRMEASGCGCPTPRYIRSCRAGLRMARRWCFGDSPPGSLPAYKVGAKAEEVEALLPEDQDRLEDPTGPRMGVASCSPATLHLAPLTIQVLDLPTAGG